MNGPAMAPPARKRFVLALAGGERCLFELSGVREVLPMLHLFETDRAGGNCLGIAQVRGEAITVFDARPSSVPLDPTRLIVLIQRQGRTLGLAVDDVLELVDVDERDVISLPSTGPGAIPRSANLRGEILPIVADEVAPEC